MILFNSLKEVYDFGNRLVTDYTTKELKTLEPDIIIDFTVGAGQWLVKTINEFSLQLLGFDRILINILWKYTEPCLGNYLARCWRSSSIDITTELLIRYPYKYVLEIIVHEISHLKYPNHTQEFRDYLFNNLKQLNLIEPEMNFDDFYKKCDSWQI